MIEINRGGSKKISTDAKADSPILQINKYKL